MIKKIAVKSNMSYSEMQETVVATVERCNLITSLRVVGVDSTGIAKFNFSRSMATLDVPSLDEIIRRINQLETGETAPEDCSGLQDEIDDLQDDITLLNEQINEYIPGVNGPGLRVTKTVSIDGEAVGTISITATVTSIGSTYNDGKFNIYNVTYDWECSPSTWPDPPPYQNVAVTINVGAMWEPGPFSGSSIGIALFVPGVSNTGSISAVHTISPFSSSLAPTIYNCTGFSIQNNATYNPKSDYEPCVYRTLGNGSALNAWVADPS